MELGQTAYEVEGAPVTFGAVLALGMVNRSILADFSELRDRMACDAYLDARGEGTTAKDITPRVNAWRNDHGLTSAELTQRWLDAHGLALDELVSFISGAIARERVAERIEEARASNAAPVPEALGRLLDYLLLSDRLGAVVQDAAMRSSAEPPEDEGLYMREQDRLAAALAEVGGVAGLCALFSLSVEQANEVLATEVRFRLADEVACADEALEHELRKNKRGLIKVEYAVVRFPSEGVALEAIASLREGQQLWLEQLAHNLGVEATREERYVDDLTGSVISTRLATGTTGAVIGPEGGPQGFGVYEVLSRVDPRIEHPEVRKRLVLRLRRRAFSSLIERKIRFHFTS